MTLAIAPVSMSMFLQVLEVANTAFRIRIPTIEKCMNKQLADLVIFAMVTILSSDRGENELLHRTKVQSNELPFGSRRIAESFE